LKTSTVELNICCWIASFASNRVINRVDRVVCVKSRHQSRRSRRLRQIASSIASIASFASNRTVNRVDRVVLRQIALLDRVPSSIASLDRVVGSRRQSRPKRVDRVVSRVERVAISALQFLVCRSASFCAIGTIFTILKLAA
jgi:hypothetical protein